MSLVGWFGCKRVGEKSELNWLQPLIFQKWFDECVNSKRPFSERFFDFMKPAIHVAMMPIVIGLVLTATFNPAHFKIEKLVHSPFLIIAASVFLLYLVVTPLDKIVSRFIRSHVCLGSKGIAYKSKFYRHKDMLQFGLGVVDYNGKPINVLLLLSQKNHNLVMLGIDNSVKTNQLQRVLGTYLPYNPTLSFVQPKTSPTSPHDPLTRHKPPTSARH